MKHTRPPVLFCNIAWMHDYKGPKGDVIQGGGSWPAKRKSELWNFRRVGDWHYGFVQPGRGWRINIRNLGAGPGDSSAQGVTVIWTACKSGEGTVVIGWYRQATVFRDLRKRGGLYYNIRARSSASRLIDRYDRCFPIPRGGKGQLGEANVWYARSGRGQKLKGRVLAYIGAPKSWAKKHHGKDLPAGGGHSGDPERRKRIEMAAMDHVTRLFKNQDFDVRPVHMEYLGWDLEATREGVKLLLEVKGTSANRWCVELTPNEFRNMARERSRYRLCVVTNALSSENRTLIQFSYDRARKKWLDERGRLLRVQKLIGARMSV